MKAILLLSLRLLVTHCYSFFESEQSPKFDLANFQQQSYNDSSYIGQACKTNTDCHISTYCCSEDKCVPGSICYNGQKQANDFCDYKFECLSRCCVNQVCSHFQQCVTTCYSNNECGTGCCSLGYCTASSTCQTRKMDGDYCDVKQECQSQVCVDNKCIPQQPYINNHAVVGIVVIIVIIFCAILAFCLCKGKQPDRSRHARGQGGSRGRSHDEDNPLLPRNSGPTSGNSRRA